MKRVWNVRLNVDEWNAGIVGLDDDADRVRFLAGFNAGLNGKPTMDKGDAWRAGWKVGNSSHLEALKFSDQQRDRVMNRYRNSTAVVPRIYRGSAAELPNYNRQSTIEESTIEEQQSSPIASASPFDDFWNAYGKKTGKAECMAKWKTMAEADRQAALAGVAGYHAIKPDPQYRVDPIRYLKRKIWLDEATMEGLSKSPGESSAPNLKPPGYRSDTNYRPGMTQAEIDAHNAFIDSMTS